MVMTKVSPTTDHHLTLQRVILSSRGRSIYSSVCPQTVMRFRNSGLKEIQYEIKKYKDLKS